VVTYPHLLIDYGHGGLIDGVYQTSGKRYVFEHGAGPSVVYEGVSNRVIAAHLIWRLASMGRPVYDVVADRWYRRGDVAPSWHDLEQADVSLQTRISRANRADTRAGLLVSVHSNAIGNAHQGEGTTATGWELFTSPGETRSDAAATHMVKLLESRGVKVRKDYSDGDPDKEALFAIVRSTRGAAVLVEHGFHTTPSDARRIMQDPAGIAADYAAALEGLLK